jgi:hypothetical protein
MTKDVQTTKGLKLSIGYADQHKKDPENGNFQGQLDLFLIHAIQY